jgi:hypothetical protein
MPVGIPSEHVNYNVLLCYLGTLVRRDTNRSTFWLHTTTITTEEALEPTPEAPILQVLPTRRTHSQQSSLDYYYD